MCSLQEVSGLQKTIELQDSEITIGRGPFLGVTDKRVSRNHGILSRVENGIELKSIHVNPCFYTKNSDDKWLKLDKNESIILHPGDTFSLLPKQYIYKVIAKETIEAQKSDSESHEIVSKNEETDQMESKAKVPSTVDPAPLLLAKISHSKEGETSKHLSQAETKHASKFNDHDSAKFKIRDAEKAADIDLSPDSDSAKIQKQAVSTELLSDNDSAKFEAHKSDEVATAQEKAENPDKECVKIHPNHSKTPKKEHPKAFAKISSTKTPTYVKRKYTNTYMDGDKEVALPSETKRKLPSWMKAKKSDATNLSRKKNDEPPKKVVKTKKITPKRPVAKKRQKVQKIDFDSDETPDELEAEPQYGSEDDKEIEADVEDHDRVTVPRGRRQEDDVTKEVEKDGDRFIIDLSPNNQNGNDVTSEDVAMVDVSIAAKSVEVDDDVAPRSDSNGLPSNPDDTAASRNSCPYGSSCYRKNPAHFAELSHPGDDDYQDQKSEDDSEKPECPYGTSCFRKNLVHQQEYKHTKRVAPKRQTKTKAARKKDGGESRPDDYDLDDSFLNDEEEEEEDISDGDSDWNPMNSQPQSMTRKSKRSRKKRSYRESDSEEETTDEDLDDLVSDAKKFATNKKMWKK